MFIFDVSSLPFKNVSTKVLIPFLGSWMKRCVLGLKNIGVNMAVCPGIVWTDFY